MNIRNPFQVGAFLLLFSGGLWITLAVLQGIFLTPVPQAPEYCNKWVPILDGDDAPERIAGSSSHCVEFINTLERLKYYHNLRMVKRNRILIYFVMGAGFLISLGLFYSLPKWRRASYAHDRNALGGSIVLGLLLTLSPMVLSIALPSPSQWAPDAINKYFNSQRADALLKLKEIAKEIDTKWLNYREGTRSSDFISASEPDGFREIKWGQHVSTVFGMKKFKTSQPDSYGKDFYIRKNENLSIGKAKLESIVYFFPSGRFCSVFIMAKGNNNWKILRDKLIKEFGNKGALTEDACFWFGYKCSVHLKYKRSSDSIVLEITHHRC